MSRTLRYERVEGLLYARVTFDYLRRNKRKALCAFVSLLLIGAASLITPFSLLHLDTFFWRFAFSLEIILSLVLHALGFVGLAAVAYRISRPLPARVVALRLFVLFGLHHALQMVAGGSGVLLSYAHGDLSPAVSSLLVSLYRVLISVGFFTFLAVAVCSRKIDLNILGLIARTQLMWHVLLMIVSAFTMAPTVLIAVFADFWLFNLPLTALFFLMMVATATGALSTVWYAAVSLAMFEKMAPPCVEGAVATTVEMPQPTAISAAEKAAADRGGVVVVAGEGAEHDLIDLAIGTTVKLGGLRITVEKVIQGPESWSGDSTIEIAIGYANNSDVPQSFGVQDWTLENKDGARTNNRPFIDDVDIGSGSLSPASSKSGSIFITGVFEDVSRIVYSSKGFTDKDEQASWLLAGD